MCIVTINVCVRACVRSCVWACVSLCHFVVCVHGETVRGLVRDVSTGVSRSWTRSASQLMYSIADYFAKTHKYTPVACSRT